MLQQAVCINNAEPPRIFTRYENYVCNYSSYYYKTKSNLKVINKIKKFSKSDNYYLLIVKDMKTGMYDVIERKIGESLTESYCYLNDNTAIDKLKKGSKIPKDKILSHSTNFDEYGNYSYGLNAKVCYMINNNTIEDAVEISESFKDRFSFNYIHERAININTNDLLINIYGDDKEYKCFPDIGEETAGKILTARRRINYENALFDLKDEQLRNINYKSDKRFYAKGTLIDIDIFSNIPIEEVEKNRYNEQIVYYLKEQERYYTEIKETLEKIIEDNGKNFSYDLNFLYRKACDYLNPNVKWKNDKTDFDNIYIVFKVLQRNPLHIGSKIAGRFGDKGVISKIVPDEDMPTNQYGERAEIVLNALGVPNRLN
jgi:DNA-directed RNA polymerase beta subunit